MTSESQSLRDVKDFSWILSLAMKKLRPRQVYSIVIQTLAEKKKSYFNGIWLCLDPSREFNLLIFSIVCQ